MSARYLDVATCVTCVPQRLHLQERVGTIQVRRGRVYRRARLLPVIDETLQVQIHHPVHVPARPHRRHAAGEIQPDEALAELPVDLRTRRVIEVLVHHHETGNDSLAGEIENRRPSRRRDEWTNRRSPQCCGL